MERAQQPGKPIALTLSKPHKQRLSFSKRNFANHCLTDDFAIGSP
jgi:hypothetical protein